MNYHQINQDFAEFMELSKQDASNGGNHLLYEHPFTGEYVPPDELCYEDKWQWLMPVVIKIESLPENFKVHILGNSVKILKFQTQEPILSEYISVVTDDKFNSIYQACHEFLIKYKK